MLKVNVGCGPNILEGYTNIDMVPQSDEVLEGTLIKMPFEDSTVDEVLAEHIFEHMDFMEEPLAWNECYRVLKSGGKLVMEVPDFEWVCKVFLEAKDEFKDFYQKGAIDHYFGNGRALDQRWSIVSTMIWGNQNGAGQYHKSGYTKEKIEAICEMIGFVVEDMKFYDNKGGQAIRCILVKKG